MGLRPYFAYISEYREDIVHDSDPTGRMFENTEKIFHDSSPTVQILRSTEIISCGFEEFVYSQIQRR